MTMLAAERFPWRSIASCAVGAVLWLAASACVAAEVDVVDARARCTKSHTCTFQVTLRHADEGWEHYADRWEVLTPDGDVLATRVLRHPHVDQQPFTRALQGVRVPADLEEVRIRGHDLVHEYGGAELTIRLKPKPTPKPATP